MCFIDDNGNRIEGLERSREKAFRKYLGEEPVNYTFLGKNLLGKSFRLIIVRSHLGKMLWFTT